MRKLGIIFASLALFVSSSLIAVGQAAGGLRADRSASAPLRVGLSDIPPCAIVSSNAVTGFSVDLWREIADGLDVDHEFVVTDLQGKLEGLTDGSLDVSIAGITLTRAREDVVDFTIPTLESGLRAAVKRSEGITPHFGPKSIRMLSLLLLLLLIFGHVLWWAEKGQSAIDDRYFPGIFEAFWCVLATMTTVGYGDIAPRRWLGRAMAVLIMLLGISFFSILAATMTADFLRETRVKDIESVDDLYGLRVGTKSNTAGADFLLEEGITPGTHPSLRAPIQGLHDGEIDVLVYDEPTILYLATQHEWLLPVGQTAYDQYYAFAVPEGSPLRDELNKGILKLRENGVYARIHRKWFH